MSRTTALRMAIPAFAHHVLLWACVPSLIFLSASSPREHPACEDQFWLLGRTCIVPGPGDPPSPVTFSKSPTPSRAVWSARCGTARAIWQYRKYPNYGRYQIGLPDLHSGLRPKTTHTPSRDRQGRVTRHTCRPDSANSKSSRTVTPPDSTNSSTYRQMVSEFTNSHTARLFKHENSHTNRTSYWASTEPATGHGTETLTQDVPTTEPKPRPEPFQPRDR